MSDYFIARPENSDAAVLSATGVDIDYPLTNLQVTQPRDYMRTEDNSNFFFTCDLGSALAVNVIALLYTNADTSTQWRIRGATSEANLTASPGYDSGTIDHWPAADLSAWNRTHALKFLTTPETFRWWRIDITGLSALDYYQAGRLVIDAAFNPVRSVDIGLTLDFNDFSFGADSLASHYRRAGKRQRKLTYTLSFRDQAEIYDTHLDIMRRSGTAGEFLVCHDATGRIMERLFYAYIDRPNPIDHGQYSGTLAGNVHSLSYNFIEFEAP